MPIRTGPLSLFPGAPARPFDTAERAFIDRGPVGEGATGAVHEVLDPRLLRRTALKRVHPDEVHPRVLARFLEEARIAGQLEHPNVVPVYEVGPDGEGGIYASMKLVEGDTFGEHIDALGEDRLAPDNLAKNVQTLIRVCDAIAYAHHRGVLHLDLKPANILLGSWGETYVADWGAAELLQGSDVTITTAGDVHPAARPGGTPGFLSPEQARGEVEGLGHHTDVFGIGTLLYYAICGAPPYDAPAAEAVYRAALGRWRPIREYTGDRVPARLVAICGRAMAVAPKHRYPDAAALRAELEQFLRGTWHMPTRRYSAGERVVTEGELGDCAWVIESGELVAWTEQDGHRLELRRMGPGSVLGEMAVLGDGTRSANVDAITDAVLLEVSAMDLEEGLGLNSWLGAFVRSVASRFREVDDTLRATTFSQVPAPTRLFEPDEG